MSGHPQNVRQSRANGAKPDSMIVGRERGPEARRACEADWLRHITIKKFRHMNVQNDKLFLVSNEAEWLSLTGSERGE
jgi:hypothetical protein